MTEEELRMRAGGGGRRVRARAAEGRRLAAVEKEAEPGSDGEGRSRAFAAAEGVCGWKETRMDKDKLVHADGRGFFFSFFFYKKRMEGAGRSMDKMGWALLMGLSSNFRSTCLIFLLLFKII